MKNEIKKETEIINMLTEAMRECDELFEKTGGGTRHYVRDLLLPTILNKGYKIIQLNHDTDQHSTKAD